MDTAEALHTIKADLPATKAEWLQAVQKAFLDKGVPTRREEGWKYSDLAERLGEIALAPQSSFSNFKADAKPGIQILGNTWDGIVPDNWKDAGVAVRFLDFESEQDASFSTDCDDPLVQWNIAAGAKGVVIDVPGNCAPDFELRLNVALLPVKGHIPLRILIRAGAFSKFQVTVSRTGKESAKDSFFLNEVLLFDLAEGASVNLERMEDFPAAGTCGSALLAKAAKSARFHAATAVLGGTFVRHNYWIRLTGPEADAALHTLSVPGNEEHFDNHIQIFHDAPHCTSDQQFKTIAGGTGKGIFSGTIQVARIAQKTNAFQNSQGMVLGPDAKVYAMPRLIIYADDVKCSHGATTGQLDEDALFYLRARGIKRSSAISLLLASFCESFFDKVTVEAARNSWQEQALRKLESHAGK
jgi:Fe-S cluster assembly protein SufD